MTVSSITARGARCGEPANGTDKKFDATAENDLEPPEQPAQEKRIRLRARINGNLLYESGGQTSYTGRIVKRVGCRLLINVTMIEGRSIRRSPILAQFPHLHGALVANTGVGREAVHNREIWIDFNEIYSIEDSD